MLIVSRTLLMMLMVPKVIKSARAVAAIMREFSAIHSNQTYCTLKENRGLSAGVERIYAILTAPLTRPITKAATIANL